MLHYAEGWSEPDLARLSAAIEALRRSAWSNPLYLRIREAGVRFFNLTWDGKLLGSIASTRKDPLQFYLKDHDGTSLREHLPESVRCYVKEAGSGHYGVGTLRVDLAQIAEQKMERRAILQALLSAVTSETTVLPTSNPPAEEL